MLSSSSVSRSITCEGLGRRGCGRLRRGRPVLALRDDNEDRWDDTERGAGEGMGVVGVAASTAGRATG